jgi:hypothetical protein
VRTSARVAWIAVILGLNASSAAPGPSSPVGQTAAARFPEPRAQTQGDRPVHRGGIELVQLDVSVLDRKRQPVTGLKAEEFTAFENGVAETRPGIYVHPTSPTASGWIDAADDRSQ